MKEANLTSYIIGFALSIALTFAAFLAVTDPAALGVGSGGALAVILILAVVQLGIQLFCFLHLGSGEGAGMRSLALAFTIGLVLIIVIGSIWIMNHLNYNMMASPSQMQEYINNQQGF